MLSSRSTPGWGERCEPAAIRDRAGRAQMPLPRFASTGSDWAGKGTAITRWRPALNAFAVTFEGLSSQPTTTRTPRQLDRYGDSLKAIVRCMGQRRPGLRSVWQVGVVVSNDPVMPSEGDAAAALAAAADAETLLIERPSACPGLPRSRAEPSTWAAGRHCRGHVASRTTPTRCSGS
jgi:hypothetical protein